ncbi:MAG TPA: hypothetical protein VJL33_05400 [Candidatus Bathyarchaeia archaeon]|nr:hypothetical protein [Candidatus Bathyarchaeia archaeon]
MRFRVLKYTSRPTPAIATDAEAVVTMVVGKGSAIVKYTISDEVLYEAAWYSAGFLGMAPPGMTPELFMQLREQGLLDTIPKNNLSPFFN